MLKEFYLALYLPIHSTINRKINYVFNFKIQNILSPDGLVFYFN
jgi:hypothetical protein